VTSRNHGYFLEVERGNGAAKAGVISSCCFRLFIIPQISFEVILLAVKLHRQLTSKGLRHGRIFLGGFPHGNPNAPSLLILKYPTDDKYNLWAC